MQKLVVNKAISMAMPPIASCIMSCDNCSSDLSELAIVIDPVISNQEIGYQIQDVDARNRKPKGEKGSLTFGSSAACSSGFFKMKSFFPFFCISSSATSFLEILEYSTISPIEWLALLVAREQLCSSQ